MAPVFQSTEAGSGSEAIASKAVAVAAFAPTCVEHQTRKRNDPRHREMDTSPSNEVKPPHHDGTPRSRLLVEVRNDHRNFRLAAVVVVG